MQLSSTPRSCCHQSGSATESRQHWRHPRRTSVDFRNSRTSPPRRDPWRQKDDRRQRHPARTIRLHRPLNDSSRPRSEARTCRFRMGVSDGSHQPCGSTKYRGGSRRLIGGRTRSERESGAARSGAPQQQPGDDRRQGQDEGEPASRSAHDAPGKPGARRRPRAVAAKAVAASAPTLRLAGPDPARGAAGSTSIQSRTAGASSCRSVNERLSIMARSSNWSRLSRCAPASDIHDCSDATGVAPGSGSSSKPSSVASRRGRRPLTSMPSRRPNARVSLLASGRPPAR